MRGPPAPSTIGRRRSWSTRSTLEFDLDPDATARHGDARVPPQSRRRRRAIGAAPLVLDGEQQHDVARRARRRAAAAPTRCDVDAARADDPRRRPTPGTLDVRSRIAPPRNVALEGLYVSSGVFCTQCEPEGFRRITYFPGPPRRAGALHGDDARRSRALPGAAVERQPRRRGRAAGRPPFRDVARSVSQALLPVRAGRRRPGGARGHVHHARRAATSRCAIYSTPREPRRAAATRWRR